MLEAVEAVLEEYQEYLPLTVRQIFYRLVGLDALEKSERAYERLCDYLARARRSGRIPWNSIRDDGMTAVTPDAFTGPEEFTATVEAWIAAYRREWNPAVELWIEAAGMVGLLAPTALRYRVPVYSSGGFDSVTAKHTAARRMLHSPEPVLVLHVGDLDPSGRAVVDSAADDVAQFLADYDRPGWVRFSRLAVTPEQAAYYSLATAPPKPTDRRGDGMAETVQVEALPPDLLVSITNAALREAVNLDALADLELLEESDRDELRHRFGFTSE